MTGMRTISLFALAATAAAALTACSDSDRANDARTADVESGGLSMLASDGGVDGGGSNGGGPVHAFKATSNIASMNGFMPYGHVYLRAGKATDGKVHVDLSSMELDPTSEVCIPDPWGFPWCFFTRRIFTYAFGTVPNTSYASGQGYAQFSATLVNGPTMTVVTCVQEDFAPPTPCTPGAGGAVDVHWRENGWMSMSQTGSMEQTFGFYSFRRSGSLNVTGADASGTVFGTSVPFAYGEIVRTTGAAIQFDSYLKP
jgi:hypothetical protein